MNTQYNLARAYDAMNHGNLHGAIEYLRQVLSTEPEHANAHSLLAFCLHGQKRLHAAEHEAKLGVSLAPDVSFGHYALGIVLTAKRDYAGAEQHLQTAIALAPEDDAALRGLAGLYTAFRMQDRVLPLLQQARDLDPENPDNWEALADHFTSIRQFDQAEFCCRQALEIDPLHHGALVSMGFVHLHVGRLSSAREHAVSALQQDAESPSAIRLLISVRMRKNKLLGLWWRFNSLFVGRSMSYTIVFLLSLYVVYRISSLLLGDYGYDNAETAASYVWLSFCAYTWVSPAIFQRLLKKEMASVDLAPDY